MGQLVVGISHVHVVVPDLEPLLTTLTDTLGLQRISGPTTIKRGDYDASFANVYGESAWIELIRYGSWGQEWESRNRLTTRVLRSVLDGAAVRVTGIALEPVDLESQEAELEARGIPHEPAGSWETGDFRGYVRRLHGLVGDNADVFFSYDETRKGDGWTRSRERASRDIVEAHEAADGGPLGIRRLAEVVVGAVDVSKERAVWQRLLGPLAPDEPGLWRLQRGPAVRVESSDVDAIDRLVFEGGTQRADDELRIDPHLVEGLDLRLR